MRLFTARLKTCPDTNQIPRSTHESVTANMRNSGLLFMLASVGLLLLLPEGWYLFSNRIRPGDTQAAFENLAEIPALQLRQQHQANLTVAAPNNVMWSRIRRSWGDPAYEVALVSSLDEYQYCLDGIDAWVSEGGRQLGIDNANWMYGFSMEDSYPRKCKSVGRMFHAAPGSNVQVHLTANEQLASGAKVVVRPVWYNTKDKLVGVDIDKDFRPSRSG